MLKKVIIDESNNINADVSNEFIEAVEAKSCTNLSCDKCCFYYSATCVLSIGLESHINQIFSKIIVEDLK